MAKPDWNAIIGAVLLAGSLSTIAAAAGDPFDDARHYVVAKENADALRLIDSGQIPIDQPNYEGWTLLHYAAEAGNLEMVKALLQRGADPTLKTKWGSTAWDVASATMVKAALGQAVAARTGTEPGAPASWVARNAAPAPRAPVTKAPATPKASGERLACNQKWKADYDLCSDTTCKMVTYRKHAQCLKTGRYW